MNYFLLSDALAEWLRRIDRADSTTSVRTLGRVGYSIVSTGAQEGATVGWVVDRDDIDPVQLRILNRIISRAVTATGDGYATTADLERDVRLLVSQVGIPPSRRVLFERLVALVTAARNGAGHAVVVTGDSGIGKTYLWRSVEAVERRDGDIWVYDKSPQSGSSPYLTYSALLVQMLRARSAAEDLPASKVLAEIMASPGRHQGGRGVLRLILSQELIDDEWATGAPAEHRIDIPAALAALLRRLAERSAEGATVLAVDDLQWLDEQSAAVLRIVANDPDRLLVVFLGRPAASSKLPSSLRLEELTVAPLTSEESEDLLRSLLIPGRHGSEERRLAAWVAARAPGNPMAIVDTARAARQLAHLGHGSRPGPRRAENPVDHKIDELSPEARTMLEYLALLLPPVPLSLVAQLPAYGQYSGETLLREAERAEVIQRDEVTGTIVFRHDSIEAAVRRRAAGSPERIAATANLLRDRVRNGDDRAAFVLARMLTGGVAAGDDETEERIASELRRLVTTEETLLILRSAADRALALLVPREALFFYEEALRLNVDIPSDRDTLLDLHLLAHQAAFTADDGHAMSRHFRFIRAHGAIEDVSRARSLWISRAYAKTWIRGAARIGWRVLADLGAVESDDFEDYDVRDKHIKQAYTFLARTRPTRLYRSIVRAAGPTNPRADLIAVTCAGLLFSLITVDPERLPVLAWITLKEALFNGPSPYSSFGFLYWSMLVSAEGGPLKRRQKVAQIGLDLARWFMRLHGDDIAYYDTRTATAACGSHWTVDIARSMSELDELYEDGMRKGYYQWATPCGNINLQNMLFCGRRLEQTISAMARHGRRLNELGLVRLNSSMIKYRQAAECLLGRAEDETTLASESDLFEGLKRSEDHLGLAGLQMLKTMIAVYAERPELAYRMFQDAAIDQIHSVTLYAHTVLWFYYGLVVAKVGNDDELDRAVKMTRRYGPHTSGPHRVYILEAERARRRGHKRRAGRLYRKARHAAIEDGFSNEGAITAEYHADFLLHDNPQSVEAIAALHEAHSLYERWGAKPAARRVSDRLRRLYERFDRYNAFPAQTSAQRTKRESKGVGESSTPHPSRRELERTRHYTQILFDATRDAILLVTDSLDVLFHNAVATPFLLIHSDDRVELRGDLARELAPFISSAIATSATREAELEWHNHVLMVSVNPVAGSPAPTAALGFRDVTTLRARERELVVADRMSSLGLLSSIVAHEIGNANHILRLNGETLRLLLSKIGTAESTEHPDRVDRALGSLLDASRRIGDILTQVREYAAGGRTDLWERLSPAEIGKRVVGFTRLLVNQHTDGIIYEAAETLPPVQAIPGRLEQALINLIKNACEALGDRSAKVALRISLDGKDYVSFAVCDQGRGMPVRAILDADGVTGNPFSSTRVSEGGTGLGLSIVRTIVEQHHGILRFGRTDIYTTVVEILVPIADRPRSQDA